MHCVVEYLLILHLAFVDFCRIWVLLIDKKKSKTYVFTLKAGFDFDGASINRLFWRIIGSKENIRFKITVFIHDILCINHDYVDNDRYFSTIVFEGLLYVGGTVTNDKFINEGNNIIKLSRQVYKLYEKQTVEEKLKLLDLIFEKMIIKVRMIQIEYKKTFCYFAKCDLNNAEEVVNYIKQNIA